MLFGCVFEVAVHLLNEGVVASCYGKLLILPVMVQYVTCVCRLPVNSPDVTQVHH